MTKGSTQGAKAVRELAREAKVIPLNDVTAEDDVRCATGIKELDRVLGGGIVPGSLVLVGGDPGIGKSTLLLQVCRILADKNESFIHFGRRIADADQTKGKPYGKLCGRIVSFM